MPIPSPDPVNSADADGVRQVDVAAVVETVRKTKTPRLAAPPEKIIRKLVEQLQEHTTVLMRQALGPDDKELKVIREAAAECSSLFPALLDEHSRAEAWQRVCHFAIVTEGLLRRWCQADTVGGDYEIRVEENEHGGYYVWDTVSCSLPTKPSTEPAGRAHASRCGVGADPAPQPEDEVRAMTAATKNLGMGHQAHPWLGRLVIDTEHDGQVGVLRAVAPDVDDIRLEVITPPHTPPVAWLAPQGGGVEWTTSLTAIEAATQ
ncbi:hypothetical protein [Streptomyces phytophilus]|uniref:hypothetical protein n=1 Tax=Streptomyces phytophilus TaxID=722715 RepID=UPI00215D6AFA|nr:hypothetical protein [Streptomyces phytophilus]